MKTSGLKMTIFVYTLVLGAFGLGLLLFWWPQHLQDQLRRTGTPATAKIVDIRPTGSWYNNQPEVNISLQIHPSQGEDFLAQTTTVINPVYLPKFQPGMTINVVYNPNDHKQVVTKNE